MAYLAFYGSLMRTFDTQTHLKIKHQLTFVQSCRLFGTLYDLGEYPGLKHGAGFVKGELYEVLDPRVMPVLDAFEGYDANNPKRALYTRSCVRLAEPNVDAWVYFYNKPINETQHIPSGDWLQFHTNRV